MENEQASNASCCFWMTKVTACVARVAGCGQLLNTGRVSKGSQGARAESYDYPSTPEMGLTPMGDTGARSSIGNQLDGSTVNQ